MVTKLLTYKEKCVHVLNEKRKPCPLFHKHLDNMRVAQLFECTRWITRFFLFCSSQFYTISVNFNNLTYMPVRKKENVTPSCTSLNYALAGTSSITSVITPNFSHGWHLQESKEVKV